MLFSHVALAYSFLPAEAQECSPLIQVLSWFHCLQLF